MGAFFKLQIRLRTDGREQKIIYLDSSRQALQTNEKLFSNLSYHFRNIGRKTKKNIQKDSEVSILIKILPFFCLKNIGVGYLCMRGGKAYVLISMPYIYIYIYIYI